MKRDTKYMPFFYTKLTADMVAAGTDRAEVRKHCDFLDGRAERFNTEAAAYEHGAVILANNSGGFGAAICVGVRKVNQVTL